MRAFTFLFRAKGRFNRAKYWLFALIAFVAYLIAIGAFAVTMAIGYDEPSSYVFVAIGCAVFLAVIVASIMVGIKRLHDRNRNGAWLWLLYGVPGVLSGVARFIDPVLALVLALISLGISIWAFVELGCLRGTTGPNSFGLDPLAPPEVT